MIPRIPALAGALLAATAATATAAAASAPPARELSCIYAATFQGVPHVGVGSIPGTNLGRAAGPGTIPGCNDFAILPPAPPVPPEPDRVVTFFRIRGVAPRFGVADGARSGSAAMVIPQGSPCLRPPNGRRIVRCLRELTARYLRGPSLVTYPSAAAGSVIQVGVHVRDPGVRRRVGYGVDAVLLQADGDGWRPVYRLASPVSSGGEPTAAPFGEPFPVPSIGLVGGGALTLRIPDVAPGPYRLAKRIQVGRGTRWLVADLTVVPANPIAMAIE
ncbi:MAG: hypothetical protein U0237_17725 [Thermoleophilia bacterium]